MKHIESDALVVRTVAYGESDVIVTLITETDGKLSALVRGGRKSTKRVGGALEPVHTIAVKLDDRGGDLALLREARLRHIRARVVGNLEALDAAGTALRWARHLLPARHAEPRAWRTINELLDALERSEQPPRVELARAALRLLADAGYALDLERCVRCGKECLEGKAAMVDAARGGLVCRACGGARRVTDAELLRVARAVQRGEAEKMTLAQAEVLVAIAEEAMAAHTGFDRS